jgi:hypothetical protein
MNHHFHPREAHRLSRWRLALGVSAGTVAAAAMLGFAEAGDAHADTGSDVLGQAGTDLTQATQLLDGAPTTSLDAEEAAFLTGQESLQTGSLSAVLAGQESTQAALPVADQQLLGTADAHLVDAFQGILNADQAFLTADQAGDLTGLTGLTDQLDVVGADFATLSADFNVIGADVGAELANVFGLTDLLAF